MFLNDLREQRQHKLSAIGERNIDAQHTGRAGASSDETAASRARPRVGRQPWPASTVRSRALGQRRRSHRVSQSRRRPAKLEVHAPPPPIGETLSAMLRQVRVLRLHAGSPILSLSEAPIRRWHCRVAGDIRYLTSQQSRCRFSAFSVPPRSRPLGRTACRWNRPGVPECALHCAFNLAAARIAL